jgi:epoxyqueuosine reductase QueG
MLPDLEPQTPNPKPKTLPEYAPRYPAPAVLLLDVLNWDAAGRQKAFERSALKRLKLEQLKRNALIVAGNYLRQHKAPALLQRIQSLAADPTEPELVRLTAQQVLDRLPPA